jgi:hypothetical protein
MVQEQIKLAPPRWIVGAMTTVVLLGAVWLLIGGVSKLVDAEAFARAVDEHGVLTGRGRDAVVRFLPWMETGAALVCVGVLAGARSVRLPALTLACIYLVFSAYAARVHVSYGGPRMGCGCSPSVGLVASWLGKAVENSAVAIALCLSAAVRVRS